MKSTASPLQGARAAGVSEPRLEPRRPLAGDRRPHDPRARISPPRATRSRRRRADLGQRPFAGGTRGRGAEPTAKPVGSPLMRFRDRPAELGCPLSHSRSLRACGGEWGVFPSPLDPPPRLLGTEQGHPWTMPAAPGTAAAHPSPSPTAVLTGPSVDDACGTGDGCCAPAPFAHRRTYRNSINMVFLLFVFWCEQNRYLDH